MNQLKTTTRSSSSQYEDPLKFDIEILHLVLKRNRNQQSRSSYFRRLDMVLRAISRHSILGIQITRDENGQTEEEETEKEEGSFTNDFNSDDGRKLGLCEILSFLRAEYDQIISIVNRHKGKHNGRHSRSSNEDYKWTIGSSSASNAIPISQPSSPLIKYTEKLYILLVNHLPEILSRILYASSALYIELSRGYFVPFCTVSLGCISRIRVLLIQLAKEGCAQYQIMISLLKKEYLAYVHTIDIRANGINDKDNHKRKGEALINEAKVFLKRHENKKKYLEDIMEDHYVEIEERELDLLMNERLNKQLRQRYHNYMNADNIKNGLDKKRELSSSSSSVNKSPFQEMLSNRSLGHDNNYESIESASNGSNDGANVKSEVQPSLEDIIGEKINISSIIDDRNQNNNNQMKDDGDNNFEMLLLLKEQKKQHVSKSKKKRLHEITRHDLQATKRTKEGDGNQCRNGKLNKVEGKSESLKVAAGPTVSKKSVTKLEKKKKRNKTKKKKKKDVIDDIFDGF